MDLSRSAASEDLAVMAAIASQTVRKWGSQPIADAAALAKGSNFLADSALYQDKGSEEHRRVRTVDHAIQVRAAAPMPAMQHPLTCCRSLCPQRFLALSCWSSTQQASLVTDDGRMKPSKVRRAKMVTAQQPRQRAPHTQVTMTTVVPPGSGLAVAWTCCFTFFAWPSMPPRRSCTPPAARRSPQEPVQRRGAVHRRCC